MRRPIRRPSSRRPNPFRELADRGRTRQPLSNADIPSELPAMIEERVDKQIQQLETKLLKGFEDLSARVVEEGTNVLTDQLGDRLGTLEKLSGMQSDTIHALRDSSERTDQQVTAVFQNLERTLASVPGFRLEPPTHFTQLEAVTEAATAVIKADTREIDEAKSAHGYCPKCTSTNVRRANRKGLFEEFLRLFFLAPFRCRACRHKFYKF